MMGDVFKTDFENSVEKTSNDVRVYEQKVIDTKEFEKYLPNDYDDIIKYHNQLHGYTVKNNDNLSKILKEYFLVEKIDYTRLVVDKRTGKPIEAKVIDINLIYSGNFIKIEDGVIVIYKNEEQFKKGGDGDVRKGKGEIVQGGESNGNNEEGEGDGDDDTWVDGIEIIDNYYWNPYPDGYSVILGDSMGIIIFNKFNRKDIPYSFPVSYRSKKGKKNPKTIGEASSIYPGQLVFMTNDLIIITDGEIPEEVKEIKEKKEKKKEKINHLTIKDVEEVAKTEGIEISTEVKDLIDDNGLNLDPQKIIIEDGFLVVPMKKKTFNGRNVELSLFITKTGAMIHHRNIDKKDHIEKSENLQKDLDLAIYNEIADWELKKNRSKNKGLEDFDIWINDKDLMIIIEEMGIVGDIDMFPTMKNRNAQKVFKKFMEFWLYKAEVSIFTSGVKESTTKVLKKQITRDGSETGAVGRIKVKNLINEFLQSKYRN